MTKKRTSGILGVSVLFVLSAVAVSAQMYDLELQAEMTPSQRHLRTMRLLSGIGPRALDAALSGKRITQVMLLQAAAQAPQPSSASFLSGMTRTACEAILCLGAIGETPGECAEALAKYHAMQMFGMGSALLLMCPTQ
ncbi:MAG: TrbM/KikA/MpfK family conjugal transfer protein [Nitrospira sp.]